MRHFDIVRAKQNGMTLFMRTCRFWTNIAFEMEIRDANIAPNRPFLRSIWRIRDWIAK
ncbi:MAG: hypothetical protein ETSY1_30375 [Candidatus Entotheonella factor]|uniref:Uncharacterized protein n=1 Tax=Entotheonella factor TaxID=1429438 RepID=W4LC48_ENTF1|nr:MAG: hypothetical protein ETSY1_30375 [Candidatus Entotheonella factor]